MATPRTAWARSDRLTLLARSITLALVAAAMIAAGAADRRPADLWDGVFTAPQAARGAQAFSTACAHCHGDDLISVDGYAPDLVGPVFLFRWQGAALGERFDTVRTRMPLDRPGSLEPQTYLDIIAFILESNDFPTGPSALSVDSEALGFTVEPRP